MSEYNITRATFGSLLRVCTTNPLYQYDYGQILMVSGIDLPQAYEVHFANVGSDTAKTAIGGADGVIIPDEYLVSGEDIVAYIYLHSGTDDGETEYKINIPVRPRPAIDNAEPTPAQQDVITQAIAALNQAVEQTAADVEATGEYKDASEQSAQAAADSEGAAMQAAQEAAESEQNALGYARRAENAADQAADSAGDAEQSAEAAADSEEAAAVSADRAEQAARESGYMFFYIDENGDLIYQRTSNAQVDFYLSDGDLYVKAVA